MYTYHLKDLESVSYLFHQASLRTSFVELETDTFDESVSYHYHQQCREYNSATFDLLLVAVLLPMQHHQDSHPQKAFAFCTWILMMPRRKTTTMIDVSVRWTVPRHLWRRRTRRIGFDLRAFRWRRQAEESKFAEWILMVFTLNN